MDGSHWLGSALLPLEFIKSHDLVPFEDAILKCRTRNGADLSIIVQIIPQNPTCATTESFTYGDVPVVRLHPFVEEFLVYAAEATSACTDIDISPTALGYDAQESQSGSVIIQHAYIDVHSQIPSGSNEMISIMRQMFQVEKITSTLDVSHHLDRGRGCLEVSLNLLITSSEDQHQILQSMEDDMDHETKRYFYRCVRQGLEGRTIQENTIVAISLPSLWSSSNLSSCEHDEIAFFHIAKISINSPPKDHAEIMNRVEHPQNEIVDDDDMNNTCYHIESCEHLSVTVHLKHEKEDDPIAISDIHSMSIDCPGYECLVKEIVDIARITVRGGSPSGVLLTGCAGVGKTRLAATVIHTLFGGWTRETVKILSCKDIILNASSTLDLAYLKAFISKHVMRSKVGRQILVLDDLDTVVGHEDDVSAIDDEMRMALHAIVGIVDSLNAINGEDIGADIPPFILGICCDEVVNMPPVLARVGRFEKSVSMQSPTEKQRLAILNKMFQSLEIQTDDNASREEYCKNWSSALAPHTAGCVAADLKRICIDAKTRSKARSEGNNVLWKDLREAARTCIPSQLAQLDVSLTREIDDNPDRQSLKRHPREAFFRAWDRFGGYEETKAKIYRTVVWPWKRHHSDLENQNQQMSQLEKDVLPPKGVIFCGPSGCGKTFAAECLAISMGLNVVRIRASDVLNKWLGGSEAAIRAIFARARAASPCILFFDELDAIATNREDADGDASDVHSRLLSTLLNEMDGVSSDRSANDVLVVGTTNRLGAIDAALLRPGRFEEHIVLGKPKIPDICEIISLCLQRAPLSSTVQINDIAELLHELEATAADVKGVCAEACSHAIDIASTSSLEMEEVMLNSMHFDFAIRRWKR